MGMIDDLSPKELEAWQLLKKHSLTTADLASSINSSYAHTSNIISILKAKKLIYCIGIVDRRKIFSANVELWKETLNKEDLTSALRHPTDFYANSWPKIMLHWGGYLQFYQSS